LNAKTLNAKTLARGLWRRPAKTVTYDDLFSHIKQIVVTVNLARAKAHLSAVLDKVETDEEVIVTRHGRAVARILSASQPKQPLMLYELAAFRTTMPLLRRSSAEFLREARDEGARHIALLSWPCAYLDNG